MESGEAHAVQRDVESECDEAFRLCIWNKESSTVRWQAIPLISSWVVLSGVNNRAVITDVPNMRARHIRFVQVHALEYERKGASIFHRRSSSVLQHIAMAEWEAQVTLEAQNSPSL
jgi:hypothetical protein